MTSDSLPSEKITNVASGRLGPQVHTFCQSSKLWSSQRELPTKSALQVGRLAGCCGIGISARRLASRALGQKKELTGEAKEESSEARAERAFLPPQLFRQVALLRHL